MIKPTFKLYDIVDSTNDIAKELIHCCPDSNGIVIRANFQKKGRGRQDHVWESNFGKNLLVSIIINPEKISSSQQFFINALVSTTLRDFLQVLIPHIPIKIKWPNDIYVQNRKIAGILIEHSIIGNIISHTIIGIGVNINQTDFNVFPPPTSLQNETYQQYDIEKVCTNFVEIFLDNFSRFNPNDVSSLFKTYTQHLFHIHELHEYLIDKKKVIAEISGIDSDGCLLMKMENGVLKAFELNSITYLT